MSELSQKAMRALLAWRGQLSIGMLPPERSFPGGVSITPFPKGAPAAACISADLELNWAWRDLPTAERDQKGRSAREHFPVMLEILEEHGVPVTWATVGHLFLKSCSKNGRPHPDLPRPLGDQRMWEDWYACDPCSDWRSDPLWYAPDLIERILSSPVDHEIGCHSFSHIDFSEHLSTSKLVAAEIEASLKAMASFDLRPHSLVYPFNHMGHHYLPLLKDYGFTAVRHRDEKVLLSYPQRDASGIYKIGESMHLGWRRRAFHEARARALVTEAQERRAVCHLWLHPSTPYIFDKAFPRVVAFLGQESREGGLWLATMRELAAYSEARRTTQVELWREGQRWIFRWWSDYERDRYGAVDMTFSVETPQSPRNVRWVSPPVPGSEAPRWWLGRNGFLLEVPATRGAVEVLF